MFHNAKEIAKSLEEATETCKQAQSDRAKSLQKQRNEIIQNINDLREGFNVVLGEVQSNALQDINTQHEDIENQLNFDNTIGDWRLANLHRTILELHKNTHPLSVILPLMKLRKLLRDIESWRETVEEREQTIVYNSGDLINQYLSEVSFDRIMALTSSDVTPYTVKTKRSFNVRSEEDLQECAITGICVLPNEDIAVVDYMNKVIKLLDSAYSIIDTCKFDDKVMEIHDVCSLPESKLACALSENSIHNVQLIRVINGTLELENKIELNHHCYGIEHAEDILYVSSERSLFCYNLDVSLIQRLYNVHEKDEEIERFAVSHNSQSIVVTLKNNSILVLGRAGDILTKTKRTDIDWPLGVCVAANNTFIVCGCASNNIVQFDETGRVKLATLVEDDGKTHYPKSIAFDLKRSRLIIGQISDHLIVTDLTERSLTPTSSNSIC